MSDRSSLAAEVFLWVTVVLIGLTGIVTVLGDDLFSRSTRAGVDAGTRR